MIFDEGVGRFRGVSQSDPEGRVRDHVTTSYGRVTILYGRMISLTMVENWTIMKREYPGFSCLYREFPIQYHNKRAAPNGAALFWRLML